MFLVHPGWLPGLLGNFHFLAFFAFFEFRLSMKHPIADLKLAQEVARDVG